MHSPHSNTTAITSVVAEMDAQDHKWGADRNQHPFLWLTILVEEVGELAQAALHREFGGPASAGFRMEAVQVAAVALQLIEQIDRETAADNGLHP
ncbi:hypothetical protein BMI79_00680 [Serratia oryzae]|uniref:Uncharacterized protein n=1 Tax=Serratia oryzae TaxID=2034155 RepID=A0A1S8CPT6_9GAMM|nr:hypothetical protein BMI79_00680 [Serratia oryzae]